MVFSATKDRGDRHSPAGRPSLLSNDEPVAAYWPVRRQRQGQDHRARRAASPPGLSHLKGVTKDELLDHQLMEEGSPRAVDHLRGWPAYHALTYGWILSASPVR